MRSLSSIGKARNTLQRWLLGQDENSEGSTSAHSSQGEPPSEEELDEPKDRITQFIEELKAGSQEWLGRVRMINFESVRDRLGTNWPKLQTRVEVLAEKIIQDEIDGRDRYLNAGNAEFLVFFADATPEESRIRCFAIVEAIHEKLFGLSGSEGGAGRRVAECHMIHRDDLALAWEGGDSSGRPRPGYQSPTGGLREAFRHKAEILDRADITESTQRVIDSIISSGAQSQNIGELTPLLIRLKSLARSLKALEPALITTRGSPNGRKHMASIAQVVRGVETADTVTDAPPLGTAWEDIAELISVLDVSADHSHADLLAALGRLQLARLNRAANALADENLTSGHPSLKRGDVRKFGYTPVYRSVSGGERIHQGIYRVECSQDGNTTGIAEDGFVRHLRQAPMALERATLEHAIQYLLDRRTGARFMLMVPVHVETLRGPHSQMRYSMILRSAQLKTKRRLLIEITGYTDTDDTIAIRRAIDELRIHSHAVFISISYRSIANLEKIATQCKRFGVHAWGMNVSQFNGQHAAVLGAIARLSSLGAQHSIPTFVDGIGDVAVLGKAIASGARYVCSPALRPPLNAPDDAERASLEDLYLAI